LSKFHFRFPSTTTVRALIGCWVLGISIVPSLALEGSVADDAGDPLAKARVCYLIAGVEELCVETDAAGLFELPDTDADSIQVFKSGFLPRVVPAAAHAGPIVVERAASLLVTLKDAVSGQPLPAAELSVVYLSGRSKGPFFANAAGVRVKTLWPGEARILAFAEGYRQDDPPEIELIAGKEAKVVLKLIPEDK